MLLNDFINEIELKEILDKVANERLNHNIYPNKNDVIKILNTEKTSINVVILGQDPYHQKGQANGYAFAVSQGTKKPPSLQNIFKEIELEFGSCNTDETLQSWVKQGVLLMNTIWTVEEGKPLSHKDFGWEKVTNNILVNLASEDVVFVAFGKNALNFYKKANIDSEKILYVPHPSPLSAYRGFFGSEVFKNINKTLKLNNKKEVIW